MTEINLLTTDFTTDPGILASSASPATNRAYDSGNNDWDCVCVRRVTETAWAYIFIPGVIVNGWDDNQEFKAALVHDTSAWDANAGGFFGFHHDPAGKTAPDIKNFVGYYADRGANNIGTACIVDKNGTFYYGNSVSLSSTDYKAEFHWNPATRQLSITFRNYPALTLLGTSILNLPAGVIFEELEVFGVRDDITLDSDTDKIYGNIIELSIDWTVPADKWVIYVPSYGAVELEEMRSWDNGQDPRFTIIDGQGRAWSRRVWDGAGPYRIEMFGTFLRPWAELEAINALMLDAYTWGRTVELYSPETYFTLLDAHISRWEGSREFQRIDNRDFVLVVESRGAPDIT